MSGTASIKQTRLLNGLFFSTRDTKPLNSELGYANQQIERFLVPCIRLLAPPVAVSPRVHFGKSPPRRPLNALTKHALLKEKTVFAYSVLAICVFGSLPTERCRPKDDHTGYVSQTSRGLCTIHDDWRGI